MILSVTSVESAGDLMEALRVLGAREQELARLKSQYTHSAETLKHL